MGTTKIMKSHDNKINLINDTNISSVKFSIDGKNIIFEFLDMIIGKPILLLECKQIYVFNYCNNFDEDEGLACYVGEVSVERFAKDNIEKQFIKSGYNFTDFSGRICIPEANNFCGINIVGGELSINVICVEYELQKY